MFVGRCEDTELHEAGVIDKERRRDLREQAALGNVDGMESIESVGCITRVEDLKARWALGGECDWRAPCWLTDASAAVMASGAAGSRFFQSILADGFSPTALLENSTSEISVRSCETASTSTGPSLVLSGGCTR